MDVFLSDRSRRFLCQVAFLMLCLGPTAFVLKWVLFPPSASSWSKYLEQETGLKAQVASIQSVSPQQSILFDIRFGEDDFDSRIVIDQMTVQNTAEARLISIDSLNGSAQAIWNFARQIETRVTSSKSMRPVIVQIGALRIPRYQVIPVATANYPSQIPIEEKTFENLTIRINGEGTRLEATCFVAGDPKVSNDAKPMEVSVFRADDSKVAWHIKTADQSLPIWIVRRPLPLFSFLNGDCLVQGNGRWSCDGGSVNGELTAKFHGINIDSSISQRIGYRWQGQADLQVDVAHIRNGQLARFDGVLTSSAGQLGGDFKSALNQFFDVQWVSGQEHDGQYRRMGLHLLMNDFRFRISSVKQDGTLARDELGKPLMICPEGKWHDVSELLSFLWHPTQSVNREMITFMNYLPLPHSQTHLNIPEMRQADDHNVGEPYLR